MKRSDAQGIIAAAAAWAFFAAIFWGTWAAGSADSYGYVSQAALWLEGDLVVEQRLAREAPWPGADWTFSPLGYRPGPEPGTIVPVYPAGLSLMMAAAQLVAGPQAVYLVVPVFAALTVLATALLGARLAGLDAGAFAALLIAVGPTFLFASMWPMTDVPAAALWTSTLVLAARGSPRSALAAGVAAGAAILTRPNLVLLSCAPGAYLLWRCARAASRRDDVRREIVRLVLFAAPVVAGSLAVAAIHSWLYGSPLSTGHGAASELFSASAPPGDSGTIAGWVFRVEPVVVLLGALGLAVQMRAEVAPGARAIATLCAAFVGLTYLSHAFFISNVDWWFVRFLLPAFPVLAALGGAALTEIGRRTSGLARVAVLGTAAFAIAIIGLSEAERRGTFAFGTAESRYAVVGARVAGDLPPDAILFAFQESGAIRHYADRPIVRFDLLPPEWLEPAIAFLRERGYQPYFVVDHHEMALFRDRFEEHSPLGRLDWEPVLEIPGQVPVRVFDPADRLAQSFGG